MVPRSLVASVLAAIALAVATATSALASKAGSIEPSGEGSALEGASDACLDATATDGSPADEATPPTRAPKDGWPAGGCSLRCDRDPLPGGDEPEASDCPIGAVAEDRPAGWTTAGTLVAIAALTIARRSRGSARATPVATTR